MLCDSLRGAPAMARVSVSRGVQHFQNILRSPLARHSIGKGDFVFDEFPAFAASSEGSLR